MKEEAEIINPGFSVADGEQPSVESPEGNLKMTFIDWQEQKIVALFLDAVAYRWDQIDWSFLDGERFDCTHIIHNSVWLKEHLDQGAVTEKEGHKHFRLNFNAAGTLQVIAKEIKKEIESGC